MNLPPVTYLTTDALTEGVGASQVLAYVERLGRQGVDVRLHSFEKSAPARAITDRLRTAGVEWHPHPFGAHGGRGGLGRIIRGAVALRGAQLVHARSDLAAASALLARSERWVWDVRSLWPDQRIAIGALRRGSPEHRVLQRLEGTAARRSTAIVTLTEAVIPLLEGRHHVDIRSKARVITTCTDVTTFHATPLPPADPVVAMLAGTLNRYYDVPLMIELIQAWRRRRDVRLDVVAPGPTPWDDALRVLGANPTQSTPDEMPERIARAHIGLSVCRMDAGASLTAAMPTKIGEFLASGRPVVVNANLGDAGQLVEEHGIGVALSATHSVEDALDRLDALLEDPATAQRCRKVAEAHFNLDRAVTTLMGLYAEAASDSPPQEGGRK